MYGVYGTGDAETGLLIRSCWFIFSYSYPVMLLDCFGEFVHV